MAEQFLIGLDINEYESQICKYDSETKEPVSVMVTAGGTRAAFPSHLAYLPKDDKWKYGVEADYFVAHKGAVLVNGFFRKCLKGEEFKEGNKVFTAAEILAKFITLSLTLANITDPVNQIDTLYITVPEITKIFAHTAEEAFDLIGFKKNQVYLIDHTESFYYHTFYQKSDVYKNDTALYYFPDEYSVNFIAIGVDGSTMPAVVSQKACMSAELPFEEKERDAAFLEFIKETMNTGSYSGAFLVGTGFSRTWAKESMAMLCRGQRKVFYGNNLFSKGACYGAMEKSLERKLKNYIYIGTDLVTVNIGMEMLVEGSPAYKPLIVAGVHWYEAENEIEFLLNDEKDLVFRTSSMKNGERRKLKMELPGLPVRPAKTTRIRLHIGYIESNKCVITATDLGFGELFPSSGLEWEEVL